MGSSSRDLTDFAKGDSQELSLKRSEISSANIISIKRRIRPSSRVFEKAKIPTFKPREFNKMEKAKGLYKYLISKEGERDCGK